MSKGHLCLLLHAHLPFVRHPEYQDPLEEDWLQEAITETYLPLLDIFAGLERDGVDWRLTMTLTPPLCEMLADRLLQERYVQHLEKLIRLAELEVDRTTAMPEFRDTALMYQRKLLRARELYLNTYDRDILKGFRQFADLGRLEIITCGATHGYLPCLRETPNAVRAQVKIGTDSYRQHFGKAPQGIWNGECGYFPGLEDVLKDCGIRYFFVDAHGILFADRKPRYGVFAPLETPSGVIAFGRDIESSRSVWSAAYGYPGDPRYREFYRDIGFDLDLEYIRPFIHESGLRTATGFKYHRITGPEELRDKQPYNYAEALEAAAQHAGDFLFKRRQQVLHLCSLMDRDPIIVAPFDAELFGHWWYEGPEFLNILIRKIHFDQDDIKMTTPSDYLEANPRNQLAQPAASSWGNNGYSEVWLDTSNDWIYRHLHSAALRMQELVRRFRRPTPLQERALRQAARELLLAQSSDWAFIMKTRTMTEYAERRTKQHIYRFNVLHDQLMANGQVDEVSLAELEAMDSIFPRVDWRAFA
jgi:1,4-alpha-glucan branching enzyme